VRLCTRNNPSIADALEMFVREHAEDAEADGGERKQRKRLRAAKIDEVRFRFGVAGA